MDSSGCGFWWTSGFTRRVFYRDVPAITRPVLLYPSRSIPIREVFSLGLRDLIRLLTSIELF